MNLLDHILNQTSRLLEDYYPKYKFTLSVIDSNNPLDYRCVIGCKIISKDYTKPETKLIQIPIDYNIINESSGLYNIDMTDEVVFMLVGFIGDAIDNPHIDKPKAQEVSPATKTFVGYKCPNCGASLRVGDLFEMHCDHCDQTFYVK